MKKSELRTIIREELSKLHEGFSKEESEQIANVVKKCFNDKNNDGVRDYKILNSYLGKLHFEVDAADIKIDGWVSNSFNRQNKSAAILLQGKIIGYLQNN